MASWFLFQAEDSVDDDVLNSFCWMYSSFDMPETFQFPCARKKYDGTYLYNTYYQWVSIFLAFNAGLFYIPRCIWLIIEGGLMSYMVKGKKKLLKTVLLTWMATKFRSTENFTVSSTSNEHCRNAFTCSSKILTWLNNTSSVAYFARTSRKENFAFHSVWKLFL